jgi:hypothetical protein
LAIYVPKKYNNSSYMDRFKSLENINIIFFPTDEPEFRITTVYPIPDKDKIKKIKDSLEAYLKIEDKLKEMGYNIETN